MMTSRAVKTPPRVRIPQAIAEAYRLDFETRTSLASKEADPITNVRGKIIYLEDPNKSEITVGTMEGWCMRSERVSETRCNFLDVFDGDQDHLDVGSLVWDHAANDYAADLTDGRGDLIVPHAVSLLPEHRGKGIGLLVVWRFLDYFGANASLAVVKPYPLNHGDPAKPRDKAFREMYRQFAKTPKAAGMEALARHWSKLGFRRLRDSEYLFLDMSRSRPSLEDLIEVEA